MQRIYVDALRVTVWLGPEDDDSQDVLPRIKSYTQQSISKEDFKALDQTVVGRLPVGGVNISEFMAEMYPLLISLFARPYWSRLWIMQETTYACPEKHVYIGPKHLRWIELDLFALVFIRGVDNTTKFSLSHGRLSAEKETKVHPINLLIVKVC
jgi:hypothetical protein